MNDGINLPAPKLLDMSHQYGCPATMAVVTFMLHGVLHRARRLWRSDYLATGKVEIYTLAPYCPSSGVADWVFHDSAFSEDWLRYADEELPSRTDVAAMVAIASVDPSYTNLHVEQAQRYAAVEM